MWQTALCCVSYTQNQRPCQHRDRITAVLCYFHSMVNYSIILWGASRYSERLFILQKKIIRILTDSNTTEHCKPLFKHLHVLTIPSLYIYNCLVFIREHASDVTLRSDIHSHYTRRAHDVQIPYHRLCKTQQSVEYQAIRFYNKLNYSLRQEPLKV